jgi:glycerophosphoryl diester phosphodiesterase
MTRVHTVGFALLDWGADGLITDYPDRLRARLAARGMPLP